MGGEEEERQKLKKIAASSYDYENDPKWSDYWSNILIPPHLSSRSDVVDHYKRKFYKRYIVSPPPLTLVKSDSFTLFQDSLIWGFFLNSILVFFDLIIVVLLICL